MTNHLAVLEERLASLESALKHAGTLAPDDYGYRFVARCRKEAEALRAAIALMRGQSEVVTIDLGESGLLHNARVTGPVRVVAKSGEQVAGNIFQPYGGWEPLVISKDPADEQ